MRMGFMNYLLLVTFCCFCGYLLLRIALTPSVSTWTPGDAVVLKAKVSERHGYRGRPVTTIDLVYRYDFAGATYHGSQIAIIPLQDREELRQWYTLLEAKAATGDPIPCFINPRKPTQAVLTLTMRAGNVIFLGVGFVLSFGTLAVLVWRQRRRHHAAHGAAAAS